MLMTPSFRVSNVVLACAALWQCLLVRLGAAERRSFALRKGAAAAAERGRAVVRQHLLVEDA
jgi:hypothetical protein